MTAEEYLEIDRATETRSEFLELKIESIGAALPLARIYDRIELPAE